jgi:hypothetical protein
MKRPVAKCPVLLLCKIIHNSKCLSSQDETSEILPIFEHSQSPDFHPYNNHRLDEFPHCHHSVHTVGLH